MNWKENLDRAFRDVERQQASVKARRHTPFDVLALTPGDTVFFVPKDTTNDRYGQRAKVVRAARKDVQNPTVRLEFRDGTERTVQARLVRRDAPPSVEPVYLQEARKFPSWKRLLKELHDILASIPLLDAVLLNETKSQRARRFMSELMVSLTPAAQQRASQLAGMLKVSIPDGARREAPQVIMAAACAEVVREVMSQAQRGGRGPVRHEAPASASTTVDTTRLDQEQRAMINLIAKCIHRRYFLSDKQIEARLTEQEREQARVHGVLRQIIGLGQREVGSADVKDHRAGKGNELHGLLHDHLTAAYQKALEACQQLHAGNLGSAQELARQVQEHRATYLVADAELERHRRKHHTGRYFHGDILSVRVEHIEHDDEGNFQAYLGMTQYYARVVFIYAEDGITLTVANAAELEALTGVRVGTRQPSSDRLEAPSGGWAALCHWVQDMSERAGGRKQGRRQEDDEHLIYRDDRGSLVLRDSLDAGLVLALDCIRRALLVGMRRQDILKSEIPEGAPDEGEHEPAARHKMANLFQPD